MTLDRRLLEEEVGEVAAGLFEPAVVPERRVEAPVPRRVTAAARVGLADAARAMDVDLVEPATVRFVRVLVPEVPFTENPRDVSRRLLDLGECGRLKGLEFALDPLVKEMICVAVSVTNQCGYCIASHSSAAHAKGMSYESFGELMVVTGVANQTNRLAAGFHVPIVFPLSECHLLRPGSTARRLLHLNDFGCAQELFDLFEGLWR